MTTLDTISSDLVHDIFLRVDDRQDLLCFLLTCRHIHEVFKLHPNSILRRVVSNEMDIHEDVLPYAWTTLQMRIQRDAKIRSQGDNEDTDEDEDKKDQKECNDGQGKDGELELTTQATKSQIDELWDSHDKVLLMAEYFSVRFKDSLQIFNTLSEEENRRFRIAAYLHWQYLFLFYQHFDTESLQFIDEDRAKAASCLFLDKLPTSKLFWIETFRKFLLTIADTWPTDNFDMPVSPDAWHLLILASDLDGFEDWVSNSFSLPGLENLEASRWWFFDSFKAALSEREVDQTADTLGDAQIVTNPGPIITKCQKCLGPPTTPQLFYNITNLADSEHLMVAESLPGWLGTNGYELRRMSKRIFDLSDLEFSLMRSGYKSPEQIDARLKVYEIMVQQAVQRHLGAVQLLQTVQNTSGFESRDGSGQETVVEGEKEGVTAEHDESNANENENTRARGANRKYHWSPTDPLCGNCFGALVGEWFYAWWLEEKETSRVEKLVIFEDDCWWGYECRTQRHWNHAIKRNHCCPQTRTREED